MTCSARLPVYTVIISAFIPNITVAGMFGLKGVVLFSLFLLGIVSALIVAAVLKRTVTKGVPDTFILELPKYQMPNPRFVLTGLFDDEYLLGLFRRQISHGGGLSFHLWTILNAVLWHEYWIEGRKDCF